MRVVPEPPQLPLVCTWAYTLSMANGDEDDDLVIGGALHLVGEDGVPALLDRAGLDIRQLKEQP